MSKDRISESTETVAATSTKILLNEFQPIVREITRATIGEKGIYGCALRASIAKSYEFTSLAYQEPPPSHGFFITATLRSLCEDLIVFTFLDGLGVEDRNKALSLLISLNIMEGVKAQSEFFGETRPWQPVVQLTEENDFNEEQELRILSAKLGWKGRQAWPTVWYMAKAASLHVLYSYLYSATSKLVHFSPHILLRMGWGGTIDDIGDHTEWTFTTENFKQYYTEFNQTYSLMLFLQLIRGPAATLLPSSAQSIISTLQSHLDQPLRWPEVVTFEELNMQSPKFLMRVLYRAAHEAKIGASCHSSER